MQPKDFCDRTEWLEAESRTDARFGTTSDEELDIWNFIYVVGEDRKDGRRGFFILAFIKSIDDEV